MLGGRCAAGQFKVEVILSGEQAPSSPPGRRCWSAGQHPVPPHRRPLADRCSARTAAPAASRRRSSRKRRPIRRIAELATIGQTVKGKNITAVRVTRNVARTTRRPAPDDRLHRRPARPGVDHAGDGPSAPRPRPDRLRHRPEITQLVNDERAVVHPGRQPRRLRLHVHDGRRLWRKNLRDNNGDGQITPGDGVDLNRNFPTRWGYDNEGSSPNPAARPTAARPRVRARDAGARRAVRAHHAGVLRQLPLGRRAAAVRHRLAGRHAVARRRDLRGDGRQRRRPGRPRLRP